MNIDPTAGEGTAGKIGRVTVAIELAAPPGTGEVEVKGKRLPAMSSMQEEVLPVGTRVVVDHWTGQVLMVKRK